MNRRYGISVVSLWPYSSGPSGPRNSIRIAKEAGFDGIQALPLKGWKYENAGVWGKDVISFEDAFMYGPLWKAILRQLGLMGEPAPLILDWLLFGRRYSPHYFSAIHVEHTWQWGSTIEINPELSNEPEDYLKAWILGNPLCWDTLHVRRAERKGTKAISSWMDLLAQLQVGSVGLIHVHPAREEIPGLLRGEESELTQMLEDLGKKFPNAPAILEVFPPLKPYKATVKYLAGMLDTTKAWLN